MALSRNIEYHTANELMGADTISPQVSCKGKSFLQGKATLGRGDEDEAD
jgi:hypothetical protein